MITSKIERLDDEGRGIAYNNGKVVFIPNTLPKEEVEYEILIDKKNFSEGKLNNILKENKNRVLPKCPLYTTCGGCSLMHSNIGFQEEYKENKIKSILRRYANIDTDVKFVKSNKDLFYRNKVVLKVENSKWGYYQKKSHNILEIDSCLLVNNNINDVIGNHDYINISEGEITIRTNYEDKILISITSDKKVTIDKSNIPSNVIGIVLNKETIYGDNYFYDMIADVKFKVSYNSFFQINNYIAGEIFDILRCNLSGENLLDLYCGVGTLGLSLANKYNNIYGIEKIRNAIEDAKLNSKENNIDNTRFFVGDTGTVLKNIDVSFDTVIIDPPRSGLNDETLEYILNSKPKNIAYISCNAITLARDLSKIKELYTIKKITGLDMFPNCHDVETVMILEKKEEN